MRRLKVWGLTATILVGMGFSPAWAADDEDDQPLPPRPKIVHYRHSNGVIEQWMRDDPQAPKSVRTGETPRKETRKTDTQSSSTSKAAPGSKKSQDLRSKEEANWMRRVDACAALKRIAEETNDLELLDLAERLDEKAWALYQERTAKFQDTAAMADADAKALLEPSSKRANKKNAAERASLEEKP